MSIRKVLFLFCLSFILFSCQKVSSQQNHERKEEVLTRSASYKSLIDTSKSILHERIGVPEGYKRVAAVGKDFPTYLRSLPLRPHGSKVRYYNGSLKTKPNVYLAVVDLPIGARDLHQCADAVMRLRAEYLWKQGRFQDIHFNFTNGFRVDYTEWMKGRRIVVQGNTTYWNQRNAPSNTYQDFWKYMELIFSYAGTLSLSKEMQKIDITGLQIGDVFIQGGSPGHAVIVVDQAENPLTDKRIFLLAQSYMPAQELQILVNPMNSALSPWYEQDFGEILYTPEWTFQKRDLKRFVE